MGANLRVNVALAALPLLGVACTGPGGSTVGEQRAAALEMKVDALAEIYSEFPELESQVEEAAGHAVFSNFSLHPGMVTFASGYGVLEDHASEKVTHLRMFRFGVGPGLAIKGFKLLFVIKNEDALADIKSGKFVFGGFADASFKFGDFGGGVSGVLSLTSDVDAYLWTRTGFALELTIAGGRVWPNDHLN